MNVTLIGKSQSGISDYAQDSIIFTALSQCYNEHFNLNDYNSIPEEKRNKIIKGVLESGHDSISEHVSFTFLIENVSRVLTHQLVRH